MSANIQSINVDQAGGVTATLIAAIAGYRVVVVGFCLAVGEAAITVESTLQDITANTIRMTLVGNATTPVVYSFSGSKQSPAFQTALSEGLELVTGAASAIRGFINYTYEPGA